MWTLASQMPTAMRTLAGGPMAAAVEGGMEAMLRGEDNILERAYDYLPGGLMAAFMPARSAFPEFESFFSTGARHTPEWRAADAGNWIGLTPNTPADRRLAHNRALREYPGAASPEQAAAIERDTGWARTIGPELQENIPSDTAKLDLGFFSQPPGATARLGEVLEHPELYDRLKNIRTLRNLEDIPIAVENMPADYVGGVHHYNARTVLPSGDVMRAGDEWIAFAPDADVATVAHEVQHPATRRSLPGGGSNLKRADDASKLRHLDEKIREATLAGDLDSLYHWQAQRASLAAGHDLARERIYKGAEDEVRARVAEETWGLSRDQVARKPYDRWAAPRQKYQWRNMDVPAEPQRPLVPFQPYLGRRRP